MGCTQSKVIEAADVYRPAPTSFALFDINTVEEPWVTSKADDDADQQQQQQQQQQQPEKIAHVPVPILEKLDKFETADDGPHSWSEVSKALEDLKPTLHNQKPGNASPPKPAVEQPSDATNHQLLKPTQQLRSKSLPFHTLDDLESHKKVSSPPKSFTQLKKTESLKLDVVAAPQPPDSSSEGFKSLKENIFIMKDRLEREREGKMSILEKRLGVKFRRDPLRGYPEKCPPGGSDSVVLYTTTLRGVRRTFEDCNHARSIIDLHRVVIDERDVSLHGEFLNELRELLGEGASVPRLFVKGRYIGGVDEVVELNETSRLSEILKSVGENEAWGSVCEGCGGARFVPCLDCGGSCKVLVGDKKERCAKCNENGLVQCPVCH